jgi:hypothetical protein
MMIRLITSTVGEEMITGEKVNWELFLEDNLALNSIVLKYSTLFNLAIYFQQVVLRDKYDRMCVKAFAL